MIKRINTLLKQMNLTAKQFAEEIGIQPSGMSHILSGRNNPSLDFVMKVVKRWPEININWLMFGNGDMYAELPLNVPKEPLRIEESSLNQSNMSHSVTDEPDLFSQSQVMSQPQTPQPVAPIEAQSRPTVSSSPITESQCDISVSAPVENVPFQPSKVEQPTALAEASRIPITEPFAQPHDNCVESPARTPVAPQPILASKKIVKMIVLYDDHSFSEYYPE